MANGMIIGLPPAERRAEIARLDEAKELRRMRALEAVASENSPVYGSLVILSWHDVWSRWPLPKRLPECGRRA